MAITTVIPGLKNDHSCSSTTYKVKGICGGASLTWLVNALKGNYQYNPHQGPALDESKRVMKVICEADGSVEERILQGGKSAGLMFGRILDRAREITTAQAFEVVESLNGKYIVTMGSHIMAVSVSPTEVWLLDNENGLYKGESVSDLIHLLKKIRVSDIGPVKFGKGKLTDNQKLWHNYTHWSILQFR